MVARAQTSRSIDLSSIFLSSAESILVGGFHWKKTNSSLHAKNLRARPYTHRTPEVTPSDLIISRTAAARFNIWRTHFSSQGMDWTQAAAWYRSSFRV